MGLEDYPVALIVQLISRDPLREAWTRPADGYWQPERRGPPTQPEATGAD